MSPRIIRNYPQGLSTLSANIAMESGQPLAEIAKNLGAQERTLHRWCENYHQTDQHTIDMQLNIEIQQLRNENARLKKEQSILKRVAAYFDDTTYFGKPD